jgi:hypothetical protein
MNRTEEIAGIALLDERGFKGWPGLLNDGVHIVVIENGPSCNVFTEKAALDAFVDATIPETFYSLKTYQWGGRTYHEGLMNTLDYTANAPLTYTINGQPASEDDYHRVFGWLPREEIFRAS